MAKEFVLRNKQEEDLVKVVLNSKNDFIFINTKNSKIFDDFAAFLQWIEQKDFVPNDECIYDFLDEMTPVLNEMFADSAKRISLKYNRDRKGGKRTKYRSKEQIIQAAMGK